MMMNKNRNEDEINIDMQQAFRDQEMRIEHTINIIRGVGAGLIGIVNIIFFGFYQGLLNLNFKMSLFVLAGFSAFFCYIWFIHRLSRPGQYHAWLKYLTIAVDYVSLTSKFALLGAERLMAFFLPLAGPDQPGAESFMAITSDRVIVFIVVFILYNFLSALRHGRGIILYSTVFTVIACGLMLVQADLGEYPIYYTILLAVFSGLLSLAISIKFNSLFMKFQNAALRLKEINVSLEQKVADRTIEISMKNKQLNEAMSDLEESNRKTIDSIQYAQRIQNSLLPDENEWNKFPLKHFIIWQPRDIVGGDIYHVEDVSSGFVVALFDCTGHGVPGALITMIAMSAIRRITIDEGCLDPAEILSRLNTVVKTSLHQDTDFASSDDGLDAAICYVNTESNTLTYAGARMKLTFIQDNRLTIIKGDRQSIGYKRSDPAFGFNNHTIQIQKGMVFYLYSDGITDQLGGEKQFPFGNRRIGDLLLAHHTRTFAEQQNIILNTYDEYKGNGEQQDDMTIIGFGM